MNKTKQTNQSILLLVIYGLILMATLFVTQSYGMDVNQKEKVKKYKKEYVKNIKGSLNEMNEWAPMDLKFPYHENLGIKYDDINNKDLFDNKYNNDFGVRVWKIYDDSPSYDAGLLKGDILMFFNGDTILNEDHLENMIENLQYVDKLPITYFRNGEIKEVILDLDYEYYEEDDFDDDFSINFKKKNKKHRLGIFGMYWSPSFIFNEYKAANDLLSDLQFQNSQIDQLWQNEFGFKFYVGKSMFLGMVWSDAEADGSTKLTLAETGQNITRKMNFKQDIWGFTFDKRYRPYKKIILSSGFFLGSGKSVLTLHQQNGATPWNKLWTDDKLSNNDYLKIKKNELVFEPRVSMMYRMFGPVWLRLETGYMLGYSNKHWQDITTEDDYVISNAPTESLFQGFTFTIAPWIGF